MLLGEVVEDVFDEMPSLLVHGDFEGVHKLEPVDEPLVAVEGFPESGEFDLLEEDAVLVEGLRWDGGYLFEERRRDEPRNLDVELGEGSVEGADVGEQLVLLESEPHFGDDSVDLVVQLHAEEGHRKL